jgi:hypothetical protein
MNDRNPRTQDRADPLAHLGDELAQSTATASGFRRGRSIGRPARDAASTAVT